MFKKKRLKNGKEMSYIKNLRGSIFLSLFLIFILIIILIILIYFLYINMPGNPESGKIIIEKKDNFKNIINTEIKQFYPETKFNHNDISYLIDKECDSEKSNRIIYAFNIVSENVPMINFHPVFENPDIKISCSKEEGEIINSDYFIAGEGGAKEIIQTGKFNVITSGIMFLYDSKNSEISNCNYPSVELHELMHVFGFQHSENRDSLMYPYLKSCSQKLDESIILELKRLYSQKNLPDLYFENVEAIKRGRYLDFNLTIKNSGVIKAKDVSFSILEDENFLDDYQIKDIEYGAGILIDIKNFRLSKKNSKEINFVIDYKNRIDEIDKENNKARVKF